MNKPLIPPGYPQVPQRPLVGHVNWSPDFVAGKMQSPEVVAMREASKRLGVWMSAALEDPGVCDEMKRDIRSWFAALEKL